MAFAESPLDDVWSEYDHMSALVKVGDVVSKQSPLFFANTSMEFYNTADAIRIIQGLRERLDELYVISMWATFEAWFRDYVQSKYDLVKAATPGDVAEGLHDVLSTAIDSQNFDGFFKALRHIIGGGYIGDAKKIREYRNWLAHGRNERRRQPTAFTPMDAYIILEEIIQRIINHELTV